MSMEEEILQQIRDEVGENEERFTNRELDLHRRIKLLRHINDVRVSEIEKLKAERDEVLEILLDVIIQATTCDDGELDSMALTSYAIAMRYLAEHDLINIKSEYGRRVIATPKDVNGK